MYLSLNFVLFSNSDQVLGISTSNHVVLLPKTNPKCRHNKLL